MQAWDITYLGGRDNVVSAAEALLLDAAGYDVIGFETALYGLGVYGTRTYGI